MVFLRKLQEGGASRSFGIEVAKIAGLPATVLARARGILAALESGGAEAAGARRVRRLPADAGVAQMGLRFSAAPADARPVVTVTAAIPRRARADEVLAAAAGARARRFDAAPGAGPAGRSQKEVDLIENRLQDEWNPRRPMCA